MILNWSERRELHAQSDNQAFTTDKRKIRTKKYLNFTIVFSVKIDFIFSF